jgi:hypothetical protein
VIPPGPGAYDPNTDTIRKCPSKWKISNAGRNVINSHSFLTPGPGSYQVDARSNKGVGFAKSRRSDIVQSALGPGPGYYNPGNTVLKHHPAFSLRPKDTKLKSSLDRYKQSIPGPGMYNPVLHRKVNSIGFGSSSRTTFVPKDQLNTPGPGSYKIPSKVAEVPVYESKIKPEEFKYT